jgi:agmatine/peptidylarginine deiminase
LFLVDWKYNRPTRIKDDTIPRGYARALNLNLIQTITNPNQLIHTGGNFMCDGLGTAFSSNLILDENPTQTESQINTIMLNYMGIDRYIKMPILPYDGIHHIDMHMKLLDEETLLIGQYPQGISDGPQIEANMLYVLDNYNSTFETPYKIVRVVQPPDDLNRYPSQNGDYRTYSNAVFVNKTVLLPFYEERYDTTALRIWRESLPGYRVIGLDCNDIIAASGAIHCITQSVAALFWC